MGRVGRIKTAAQLLRLWEEYKKVCDSKTVTVYDLNRETMKYRKNKIVRPVTYTIKGFAVFCGMTEQNFHASYGKNPKFESVIARVREECEIDAREKFEMGLIPAKLAGLWMSNYGYSTKEVSNITGADDGPLEFVWPKESSEAEGSGEKT